jgi:hypothetical protein
LNDGQRNADLAGQGSGKRVGHSVFPRERGMAGMKVTSEV